MVGISITILWMDNRGSQWLHKMASITASTKWRQHSILRLQSLPFLGEADSHIIQIGPEEPGLIQLDV